jgi:hypothetical protein
MRILPLLFLVRLEALNESDFSFELSSRAESRDLRLVRSGTILLQPINDRRYIPRAEAVINIHDRDV